MAAIPSLETLKCGRGSIRALAPFLVNCEHWVLFDTTLGHRSQGKRDVWKYCSCKGLIPLGLSHLGFLTKDYPHSDYRT